jgi:hypothetical protein
MLRMRANGRVSNHEGQHRAAVNLRLRMVRDGLAYGSATSP